MKMPVSHHRWNLRFRLPSRLIFSPGMVYLFLKKQGSPIPYQGARALCREIRRQKKLHPDWNLVEFMDGDSRVTVRL